MSIVTVPFQLLEINIISAQDLDPISRSMRTYALAWVHPTRRLTTRVDSQGHTNPTWNEKFVFRVDDEFLRSDTSAVMVEIYALHWFKDIHVGTVRVLVGNLIPPPARSRQHHYPIGMRFVALQVRRQSGRPQGILNIGVALLDSSMRSMPMYTQPNTSAVGYRHLMGEDDSHGHHHHHYNDNRDSNTNQKDIVKPIMRRTQSERSHERDLRVQVDDWSSIISGSELGAPQKVKGKRSKASSLINGIEVGAPQKVKKATRSKAGSKINGSEVGDPPKKDKNGKPSSIVNGLEPAAMDTTKKLSDVKPISKFTGLEFGPLQKVAVKSVINGNANPYSKIHGYEFGGTPKGYLANRSMLSESDVGPSPSEVAAAVAAQDMSKVYEGTNSTVDGWSLDGSVEGLRSKLERWRTELPPLYDRGDYGSLRSSGHVRRHTDGGGGLFSCFGNIYGYECSCICGKPNGQNNESSGRTHLSPSMADVNRGYA